MQVLGVTFVEPVLCRVAPTAAADVDAPTHAERVLAQLFGDGDVDRWRAAGAVADEDPDHAEPLGDRVRRHGDLPADR